MNYSCKLAAKIYKYMHAFIAKYYFALYDIKAYVYSYFIQTQINHFI